MKALSLAAAALVLSQVCPPAAPSEADGTASAPVPEQLDWLRTHGVPFATDDPAGDLADLEPLREIVGDARIVALGECTHGTREVFRMKHRILRFLAEEMGFSVFSIEANLPEAYAVGDWVAGGEGDPAEAVAGMYFWTWNTEEVVDMVRWMREYRESGRGDIAFTGFDMQYPKVAAAKAASFVETIDSGRAKRMQESYDRALSAKQAVGFGVVTWAFPVQDALGKNVRYRGWIRTEDVSDDGFGGLWWRVDGEGRKTLAFDNLQDRGPKGTADWAEYVIELDVPDDAVSISFGVLMPGTGKAWFDGLGVELDGEPWNGDLAAELGFEQDVTAYRSQGGSHRSAYDEDHAKFGRRCMRLESAFEPSADAIDAEEAVAIAGEIAGLLKADRERLAKYGGRQEADRAIRDAIVVHQSMRLRARAAHRDECMAENVEWILQRNRGARIVLWAHNLHVSRSLPWMGAYLAERWGDDYLPVAFATGHGEYFAKEMRDGEGELGVHPLAEPEPGSIESFFDAVGEERLIVDLRRAAPESPASGWLHEERPLRSLGALVQERQFYPADVADAWDVLIWFAQSEAARQMDTPRPKAE